MAACRMAAKGKSMADRGYDAEVKSIQAFLSMQVNNRRTVTKENILLIGNVCFGLTNVQILMEAPFSML